MARQFADDPSDEPEVHYETENESDFGGSETEDLELCTECDEPLEYNANDDTLACTNEECPNYESLEE